MYVCRVLTEESPPALGRGLGGRDHTTLLHSVRKVEVQMTKRTGVYDKVVELMNRLVACLLAAPTAASAERLPGVIRTRPSAP